MSNVEADCMGKFLPGFAFSEPKNIDFCGPGRPSAISSSLFFLN